MVGRDPRLSVIVPIYNEEATIERCVTRLAKFLRSYGRTWEIVAVDDGSRDSTPVILGNLLRSVPGLKVIRIPKNNGKGSAVRTGLKAAQGDIVLFTDCDLSTPPSQIPAAVRAIERGNDVAAGSRHLKGSRIPVPQPVVRRLAGRVFNLAIRVMLGLPFSDTQCGFKAFSSRAAKKLAGAVRVPGFAFDVELLLLAKRLGLTTTEFPIVWSDNPATKIRLFRDSPQMFLSLIRLQRRFDSIITYHPARALPLILASCLGAVLGQILYKKGAMEMQGIPFGIDFATTMITNHFVIIGMGFFLMSAVTWIMALAKVDLSFAFPMLSLNFVFTALYAWAFFGEHLSLNRVAGISLVICGVLAIAASGRTAPRPGS